MIERKKALAAAGRRHRRGLAHRAVHRPAARPVRARPGGGELMPVGPDGWFDGGRPIRWRAASGPAPRAARSASSGGRAGSSTSWRASATPGRLARGRTYARKGQVLDLDLVARPGRRPGCRARGRSRTSHDRDPGVRRRRLGAGSRRRWRRRRSTARRCWPARCRTRSWRSSTELGLPLFPAALDMDVLVPRLGRAVQAPVGGALPAGRGVRRRPVPGARLARPRARGAARRAARHVAEDAAATPTRCTSTTCRSTDRLADFYAPGVSLGPAARAARRADRAAGAAAARPGPAGGQGAAHPARRHPPPAYRALADEDQAS